MNEELKSKNNWPDDVRLKMIERSEFYTPHERVYQYGYYDGYQKALEAKPKADEWVSVAEELPEKNQRVLVLEYSDCVTICNYKIDTVFGDKSGKYCFMDEQDEQPGRCYPTHWQSLPTPPNQ